MTGLERRLVRLEAAAGIMAEVPMIFVRFVAPDDTERSAETATVNGRVWHRAEGEAEAVFLARVQVEAKPTQPGSGMLGYLA